MPGCRPLRCPWVLSGGWTRGYPHLGAEREARPLLVCSIRTLTLSLSPPEGNSLKGDGRWGELIARSLASRRRHRACVARVSHSYVTV
eukprot:4682115-Pleurochrysis_carterae.AAC.1